jgi:hypothetical protein
MTPPAVPCPSCGNLVRFAKTVDGCHFLSLDAKPCPEGTYILEDDVARPALPGMFESRPRYRRHYLSCQVRDQRRGSK